MAKKKEITIPESKAQEFPYMQDLQDIKTLLKSVIESLNVIAERVDIHGGF
jgi:hypothetical protein